MKSRKYARWIFFIPVLFLILAAKVVLFDIIKKLPGIYFYVFNSARSIFFRLFHRLPSVAKQTGRRFYVRRLILVQVKACVCTSERRHLYKCKRPNVLLLRTVGFLDSVLGCFDKISFRLLLKKKCPALWPGTPFSCFALCYLMIFIKAAFVKNLVNSKSEAAFLANAGSFRIALFRLLVTIEMLLVLAPTTAIR